MKQITAACNRNQNQSDRNKKHLNPNASLGRDENGVLLIMIIRVIC